MDNQLAKKDDVLRFTLRNQQVQGKAMLELLDRVEGVEKRINNKADELEQLVLSATDLITLMPVEEKEFQSVVGKKSTQLARDYFGNQPTNTDLFMAKVGQLRQIVYRHAKQKFNVSIYRLIKRTDFKDAKEYVQSLSLSSFEPYEIRMTDKQKRLKEGDLHG